MANGWYVVYIICCLVNGGVHGAYGHSLKSPLFWIATVCVILSYVAGSSSN